MEMSDRLSAFVAVLMTAFACTVTAAAPTRCSGTDIFVAGADDTDVAEACRAAAEARGVLQAIGLELPWGVAIRLVERAGDDGLGVGERARYETGSHAIVLRGYATTARAMPPGLAEDSAAAGRAVWRSYVVHELAHAAIHLSCVSTCPRRAVHEYVAAVAQYSSLPADLRADLVGRFGDVAPWGSEVEISDTYYAVDPERFAVKSYLHYRQPQAGPEFVRRLVHGGDR